MEPSALEQKFSAALAAVVAQVRQDRSILAAILCGSLSHDRVWAKSDIDLALVTIDDRKVEGGDRALYAEGLNVHAFLVPRARFRQIAEGSRHNSFMHSLLAKGRLLYTHDETIAGLCAQLQELGAGDQRVQLLRAATAALPPLYKAHKWFLTRGDLEYSALWLLYAAVPLAQVEVIGRGLLADREVLPQALGLNPGFFKTVYTDLLNARKTRRGVQAALDAADGYLAGRAPRLFAPVTEYLREAGEARSCTEIDHYFQRHLDVSELTTACEYLADQGLIGKAATPAQLTKRSNVAVQELAFFYLGEAPDA